MIPFPPDIRLRLDALFDADGPITRLGLGKRTSQQQMFDVLCSAWSQNKGAMIEAPTGTGKTFGYLLPSLEYLRFARQAVDEGEPQPRIVISTATKGLQDQLGQKDFPALRKIYPEINTFVWKGASNYLCLNRLRRFLRKPKPLSPQAMDAAQRLWDMRERLMAEKLGMRENIPLLIPDELWNEVCGATPCCGLQEKDALTCFKRTAFAQAKNSHILCVNHSFLAHLGLYADMLHPAAPKPDSLRLIVDEGHELLHQLRGALNKDFNLSTLFKSINQLQMEEKKIPLKNDLQRLVDAFTYLLEDEPLHVRAHHTEVVNYLTQMGVLMIRLGEELKKDYEFYAKNDFLLDERDKKELVANYTSIYRNAFMLLTHLKDFPPDRMLEVVKTHASVSSKEHVKISLTPFNYEQELNHLYSFTGLPPIYTSATLLAGSRAQNLRRLCLNPESVEVATLNGEFDYHSTVKAFYFPNMEDPATPPTLARWLKAFLPLSQGNALILFTNYQTLNETFELTQEWGEAMGFRMLRQESSVSVQELTESMKRNHNTVIFGNSAFWTGIDIKGVNLSSLIITKLPFHTVDNFANAYSEYLSSQKIDPFKEWMLPDMLTKLRQGIGRLKRDEQDKGLLFILDPRFVHSNYHYQILGRIPRFNWQQILTPADLPPVEETAKWLGVTAPSEQAAPGFKEPDMVIQPPAAAPAVDEDLPF